MEEETVRRVRMDFPPKKPSERASGPELLRILAIFLIVIHHYAIHGGVDISVSAIGVGATIVLSAAQLGNAAVAIFMLLSGYFQCDKTPHLKKIVLLLMEASFYSGALYFLMAGIGETPLAFKPALKALFPYFYEDSWFIGAYLITYSLSPFLNKGLKALTRKQFNLLIVFISVLWFIFPALTGGGMYLSNLIRVIALYCIGVFLRRSMEERTLLGRKKTFWWLFLGSSALLLLSATALSFLGTVVSFTDGRTAWFYATGSPLVLGFAYGITGIFLSMNPFFSKPINLISSTTLGIYLIHDNQYFKPWLWKNLVKTQDYPNSPWLIPHMIGWSLAILAACVAIDLIRQFILERPLSKFVITPILRKPEVWIQSVLENT